MGIAVVRLENRLKFNVQGSKQEGSRIRGVKDSRQFGSV